MEQLQPRPLLLVVRPLLPLDLDPHLPRRRSPMALTQVWQGQITNGVGIADLVYSGKVVHVEQETGQSDDGL